MRGVPIANYGKTTAYPREKKKEKKKVLRQALRYFAWVAIKQRPETSNVYSSAVLRVRNGERGKHASERRRSVRIKKKKKATDLKVPFVI